MLSRSSVLEREHKPDTSIDVVQDKRYLRAVRINMAYASFSYQQRIDLRRMKYQSGRLDQSDLICSTGKKE